MSRISLVAVLGALVVAVTLVVTWALWPREEPLGPGGQPVSAGEQAAVLDFTVARPHWTDGRPGEISFSGDLVVWNETAKERSGLFAADIRIHERFALQKAPAGAVPGSPVLADRLLVWTQGSADAGQEIELWAAHPPRSRPFPLVTTAPQPAGGDEDAAPAGPVAQASRIKALDATGETVVWLQRVKDPDAPDGVDDRIWLYGVSGAGSRRLDVAAGPKSDLAIADGLVAWAARGDTTATTGVWVTATATSRQIRVAAGSATSVAVSGSRVVWSTAAGDILGFDLRTRRRFTVSTAAGIQSDVQIDGDLVVWVDGRDSRGGDIYALDLATDTEMAVSADKAVEMSPRVSGDTVVWLEERSAGWQICGAVVRD